MLSSFTNIGLLRYVINRHHCCIDPVNVLLLLLSTPLDQRAASRVQHPNHVAANSLSPQVARKGSTLSGFVQRSRLEREVGRICTQISGRRCDRASGSGQSGEGCRGSPMEKRYETRSGDLFVRSWARVRRVSLDRRIYIYLYIDITY